MVKRRMVERQKYKPSKIKEEGKHGIMNGMTKEQWKDKRRMKQPKSTDGNTKVEWGKEE